MIVFPHSRGQVVVAVRLHPVRPLLDPVESAAGHDLANHPLLVGDERLLLVGHHDQLHEPLGEGDDAQLRRRAELDRPIGCSIATSSLIR